MAEIVNETLHNTVNTAGVPGAAGRPSTPQKRQAAHYVKIRQILDGEYVKEGGWTPNYIHVDDRRKISRVNLVCAIVSKNEAEQGTSVIVDDGSATIMLRTFDNADAFSGFVVGQTINVIGRPREYGTERYIIPEIMKKIENPKWIAVRQKELELLALKLPKIAKQEQDTQQSQQQQKTDSNIAKGMDNNSVEGEEEIADVWKEGEREKTPSEKIYDVIKELDSGEGAEIQELIEKANELKIENTEQIINNMISNGDIFEVRAGRVKVL